MASNRLPSKTDKKENDNNSSTLTILEVLKNTSQLIKEKMLNPANANDMNLSRALKLVDAEIETLQIKEANQLLEKHGYQTSQAFLANEGTEFVAYLDSFPKQKESKTDLGDFHPKMLLSTENLSSFFAVQDKARKNSAAALQTADANSHPDSHRVVKRS